MSNNKSISVVIPVFNSEDNLKELFSLLSGVLPKITDVNKAYLELGKLKVTLFGRGTAWLDTGTHESLLDASQFIEVIEKRQGLKIGCIEEIAYRMNFIGKEELLEHAERLKNSGYGEYIKQVVRN